MSRGTFCGAYSPETRDRRSFGSSTRTLRRSNNFNSSRLPVPVHSHPYFGCRDSSCRRFSTTGNKTKSVTLIGGNAEEAGPRRGGRAAILRGGPVRGPVRELCTAGCNLLLLQPLPGPRPLPRLTSHGRGRGTRYTGARALLLNDRAQRSK